MIEGFQKTIFLWLLTISICLQKTVGNDWKSSLVTPESVILKQWQRPSAWYPYAPEQNTFILLHFRTSQLLSHTKNNYTLCTAAVRGSYITLHTNRRIYFDWFAINTQKPTCILGRVQEHVQNEWFCDYKSQTGQNVRIAWYATWTLFRGTSFFFDPNLNAIEFSR